MDQSWRSALWYKANFWAMYTLYTLGFSLRTEGLHNVPRRGPVLILANHESFLDPVAIGIAVRRRICYLARKTLFKNKLLGNYLRSVGCIELDQEGVGKEGIKTSINLLQGGNALLVFPEGERTLSGHMVPFKAGITLLLKRVSVPILPVGVAGAYEAYPRSSPFPKLAPLFWPANGTGVAVSVGRPIPSTRFANMPREQMLKELFDEVKVVVDRAEKLRRKP